MHSLHLREPTEIELAALAVTLAAPFTRVIEMRTPFPSEYGVSVGIEIEIVGIPYKTLQAIVDAALSRISSPPGQ